MQLAGDVCGRTLDKEGAGCLEPADDVDAAGLVKLARRLAKRAEQRADLLCHARLGPADGEGLDARGTIGGSHGLKVRVTELLGAAVAVRLHKRLEAVLERAERLRVDVDAQDAHDLGTVTDEERRALQRPAVRRRGDVVAHEAVLGALELLGHLERERRGGRADRATGDVAVHDLHDRVGRVGEVMQGHLSRRSERGTQEVHERDERGDLLVHVGTSSSRLRLRLARWFDYILSQNHTLC